MHRPLYLAAGVILIVTMNSHAWPGKNTGFLNKTIEIDGEEREYVVYLPADYTPDTPWPLIMFLHGAGERGDDGLIQTEVGIGTAIRRHRDWFPAVVVMPQCPEDLVWTDVRPHMEAILAAAREDYNIDPQRIYLTGISMGGYGTWIWGAEKADTFAALLPICGGGSALDLIGLSKGAPDLDVQAFQDRIKKLAALPIWAFHGADDDVVPPARSEYMAQQVNNAGGQVKLTIFEDTGHNSWDQAYGMKEAIDWLLAQRK
jgi:predicted peptidase